VDVVALKEDLSVFTLCNDEFAHLDDLVNCYNSTLSSLIDRYAPLNKRSVLNRPHVPWIDSDIKAAIRERRKAERKWRANKLPTDFATFKMKKNYVTKLMNRARSRYYSDFIRDNSSDQRKLFRAAKSLLSEPKTLSLPDGTDTLALANNIGEFFAKKVKDIQSKLDTRTSSSSIVDATL